jgi:hypothetical protein
MAEPNEVVESGSPVTESPSIDLENDPLFANTGNDDILEDDAIAEDGEEGDDTGVEPAATPEISDAEKKRREDQSWKDKAYALEERLKALETPVTKADDAVQTDPIVTELDDYATKLNALVESGDITVDDARLRYTEQYNVRTALRTTMANVEGLNSTAQETTGERNFNALSEAFSALGIKPDTDEYREAILLLKTDWNMDSNNKAHFAKFNRDDINRIAKYVAPAAKNSVATRKGGNVPPPPKTSGGSKPPPRQSEERPKFKSLRDISVAAKR